MPHPLPRTSARPDPPLKTPLAIMVMIAGCAACAMPVKGLFPPGGNTPTKSVFLVNQGWHASLVVKRSDIPEGVWPERDDFPRSEYLEVGWGDRRFYQTPDPHWGILLMAALWPTPSVLHVAGFSGRVSSYFPTSEIIEIKLSYPGFERLCRTLADSFARNEAGRALPLGPGRYGESLFYPSRETYHLFKTCNVWIARALRAGGCPITPALAIRVDGLMSRARTCSEAAPSNPAAAVPPPVPPAHRNPPS